MSLQICRQALGSLVACLAVVAFAATTHAQSSVEQEGRFRVQGASERMEIIVNSSRILEFASDIPRLLVNNPDLVSATPLTPNSVQISAKKQGYTQLNVWDLDGKVSTVDILILGDIRELDTVLKNEFPEASLRLRPLNSSLYITGYVPKADLIGQIVRVAEDYFPKVVNNITVGGVQEILLHVKVMEVSRTKLRQVGVDWNLITNGGYITNGAAQILTPASAVMSGLTGTSNNNVRFGLVSGSTQFNGFLDLLQQNNLAKLLAEPTLTTMSGRPASFNVGGEIPVPLLSSNGAPSILFREFGTQIDFVPIVLGNGLIRLEVRPAITEVDSSLAVNGVPGFRSRRADVGVEMQAGETLAIAGLVYTKNEAEVRGVPVLADLPWVGTAFRKTTQKVNEVELVIMVRPEFAASASCEETPPCGPGMLTTMPSACEQYNRAYLEVPKCCNDGACGSCDSCNQQQQYGGGYAAPAAAYPTPTGSYPVQSYQGAAARPAARPAMGSVPQPNLANAANQMPSANAQPTAMKPTQPRPAPATMTPPTTIASHPLQSRYTADNRNNTSQVPQSQNPSLIGPVGYDDLR